MKHTLLLFVSLSVLCLPCLAAEKDASRLRVGAAVGVTPQQFPVNMPGLFRARMADRVHDPLYARALVLENLPDFSRERKVKMKGKSAWLSCLCWTLGMSVVPGTDAPVASLEKPGWKLTFHDEFDRPQLNEMYWFSAYRSGRKEYFKRSAMRADGSITMPTKAYEFRRRITDGFPQGDGQAARQAVAEHIQTSRRETLDQLDRHHTTLDPDAPIADDLPTDLVEELQRIEERDLKNGK